MASRTVLISGAGVAGPVLAFWLARLGFAPTVVERAAGIRSSGNPVDVRGAALRVAQRMGITPALREAATATTELSFVDAAGRAVGRMPMQPSSASIELPRMELARVLLEAARDDAEFVFGDAIASIRSDADGVDVTFERGAPRRFDLVVGADGVHSSTRRLAFGDESGFVGQLGMWVATLALDGEAMDPRRVLMFNEPGRSLSLHPATGTPIACFIWRAPADPAFDHRDTADHRRRVAAAYEGSGWRVPEMLQRVRETDDLYFDAVSRVRVDRWSRGRVTLVGDAATSVSLFGEGSSLAIAGAATLADALAAHPGDHEAAFRSYEATHRRLAAPKQSAVRQASALLVPATRLGIAARNAAAMPIGLVVR